ncbi:MAG: glycosyltransferase family 2 protein [bacterium]|nr:glycosyltransferase family 2 protein [bacterium]
MAKDKISCIICAYNEEQRISDVLKILDRHPLLDEVIVVDDGSRDKTREIVGQYKNVRLLAQEVNKGKSHAMAAGINAAKNELLMFIDADLVGLKDENISDLAEPVLSGQADVAFSLRKNTTSIYTYIGADFLFQKILALDYLTGERVLPRSLLLPHADEISKLPGYGVESFMNKLIIKNKMRVAVVRWENVSNPTKSAKEGFWKGLGGEFRMVNQIFKVLSLREIIYQNYSLFKLSRDNTKF